MTTGGLVLEPGAAVTAKPDTAKPDTAKPDTAKFGGGEPRPALMVDVELSTPLRPIVMADEGSPGYREAWLVARLFGEPIALLPMPFVAGVVSVSAISATLRARCAPAVRDRVLAAGGDAEAVFAGRGTGTCELPAFISARQRWQREGPPITVVICTRNRPTGLARALDSLAAQSYQRFGVLVVDNAPADDRTESLVRARADSGLGVRYTREDRAGLSWARNHGLALVRTPVVAWLDDDETADRHWLVELAGGFAANPGAAAVSGAVVPAELATEPQLWFEQYGGHTKGRGLRPAVFAGPELGDASPLYPLPAFGVGANMAFDAQCLREIGGFDTALGAGTASLGGEDTLVFSQLLLHGHTVVYRPSALTRHYHRPEFDALARQMTGYGVGLTAYYTSLLCHDWRLVFALVRLAPRALRDTFGARGRMAGVPDTFPRELLRLKTRGMLKGPAAYARARWAANRMAGARP